MDYYRRKYLSAHDSQFKAKYTPEQRQQRRKDIIKKCRCEPDQVLCVVLEKPAKSQLKTFTKPFILFGINKQATLFDLRRHIQKLLHLGQKDSLFLVCGNLVPNSNQKIKDLEVRKESDGFVYLLCSEFDVFG